MDTESTPTLPFSEAKAIFGEKNCINPEVVGDILKVKMGNPELSLITCSIEELEQHAEAGRFLTFRINKTFDGKPMTMKSICKLARPKMGIGGDGNILVDDPHSEYWYKKKAFFAEDAPRPGFAIIDKDIALDSANENFLRQTEIIARCASSVFQTLRMPRLIKEALREFEGKMKEEIFSMEIHAGEIAKKLADIQLTKLFRQTPVEFLYDSELYLQQNSELLCKDHIIWTSCLDGNSFVFVEGLNPGKTVISKMKPEDKHELLGTCFVRPLTLKV